MIQNPPDGVGNGVLVRLAGPAPAEKLSDNGKQKNEQAKGLGCLGAGVDPDAQRLFARPAAETPVIPAADAYKEIGPWTQAQPADRLPRDSWWALLWQPELEQLEKRLIDGNPTLAAALANYAQARALADQARAGLFPTLGVSASAERNRESKNAPLREPRRLPTTTPTH